MTIEIAPNVYNINKNDRDFIRWMAKHPNGYFCNSYRSASGDPTAPYMLHRSGCSRFTNRINMTNKQFCKVVSTDRTALLRWAKPVAKRRGHDIQICGSCA